MIDFLIKSTIALFTLLAVYHLLLEKEKMHQFNRFYLLFSLLFSISIPFYTIEIIKKVIAMPLAQMDVIETIGTSVIQQDDTNYLQIGLLSLYSIITAFLLIRFIYNLLQFNKKKRNNTSLKHENTTVVLLEEITLPYTFLNTIFMNKLDYENKKIEPELFTHELIHVNQKHTLDVLFIEILKTIFWFNPIFIFYKKAIQLNHEFLADEKVVQSHNNVSYYQNLLITKANANPTYYLASNLNYSVTKKRLIMMTKTASTSKITLKKITLFPIFSALVFFLCVETVAQGKSLLPNPEIKEKTTNSREKQRDYYFAGVRIIITDKSRNKKIDKIYEELTSEEKEIYLKGFSKLMNPREKKSPTKEEFEDFKNSKKYAIWIDGKHILNSTLNNYSTNDFAYYSGSSVYKNARTSKFSQPFQFQLYTFKYFDEHIKNSHLKFGNDTVRLFISLNPRNLKKNTVSITDSVKKQDKTVHSLPEVDKEPEFPGGIEKFYQFVGENFKLPKTPDDAKLKGKIYTTFVIEKDGSLSDIKVTLDIGYRTWKETLRVLKLCPNWNPGEINSKPVRTLYSLPITIQSAD